MRCFAIDLTQDLRDHTRTDGVTTFTDGEAQPLFDHDRRDELDRDADVVAGLARVEELAEHLDAGHDGLLRLADAEDLDVLADLDRAAIDTTGGDGPAALDAEHVLDGHLERLVLLADRGRDVAVDRV